MRHRLRAFRLRHASLILPLLVWLAAGSPAAAQNNPFNSDGFPAARGTYGSFPYEQVDPLSGNLIISVTDLSLPGPIPLTVSRSYNSKFHRDFEHGDQGVDEWSPLGVGWRMHFGRVLHAESTTPGTTIIEGTDGGGGGLYQTSAYPEGWITKGFVRYNRMNHTAKAPNGLTYTFGHIGEASGPRGQVRYITAITDQFGNTITFHYEGIPGLVTRARQVLNANQVRDVYFVYNANGTLTNIQYGDRVWTFQHDPAPGLPGHTLLRKVIPPAGLPWEHVYGGLAGLEFTALIAPGGGRVDYTYETKQRRAGSLNQNSRVVSGRSLSGRGVTPAPWTPGYTWTFSYNEGANLDTTVVACPCGTTSYRYNGIGISSNFSAWASGTLAERQVRNPVTGAVLEQETLTYGASAAISPDSIPGEGGQWGDPDVYNALTVQRVLSRPGGGTWTTTYEYNSTNYNDFGRAYKVIEQGDLTRISEVTFQYGFTPWIIGGTSSTSVRLPPADTVQTSTTTYDLSTGLVTASTSLGVATTFTANANGTVASATNANGHTTQFFYNWGVLAETRNPILWTARGINPDGTVGSELVGNDPNPANNLLTTYGYDEVGRIRYVQPRNGNIIRYTYEDVQGNLYVQVDRGASQVWTHLDGFGRAVLTVNSLGVRTRIDRDGCGRVLYASGTYTTGDGLNRGTTTTYDWLGRVIEVSVTDPSGTPAKTSYAYPGTDVEITDAIGRKTIHHNLTFGGPGDGRLMWVKDANNITTSYQYDTLGNLTRVDGPGTVPARTWQYNAYGRLLQDTQPESGTTSYTYDALGNLKTVTDSAGRITRLTYDNDERLTKRQTDGDTTSTLDIQYDLVGRVKKQTIAGVETTTTYDNAGRVASRTDGIHPNMWFTSNYAYDGNDNLTEIRYPCVAVPCDPRVVKYVYDVENRLTGVLNNNVPFASNFTYDGAGRLATYQTGVVTHRFDYDSRDRVSWLRAGASSNPLDLTYTYSKVSQVTAIADGRGAAWNQSFGYDNLDRLAVAYGPYGQISWAYDAAGNRTAEDRGLTTSYNYNPQTNRLMSTTGANPEAFTYTTVGEVSSDSQGTYTYMPNGMLHTANRSGMAAAYLYDPNLLRVKRVVNNIAVVTVRGAGGQVLTEAQSRCGGPLEWVRDNIYAGGKLLGAVRNGSTPTTVQYVHVAGEATFGEANGLFGSGVRLTTNGQPLGCPVTVSYQFVPDTATPTVDYTGTNGTLTFPAGSANGSVLYIEATPVNDAMDEADERFRIQLTGAVGAVLGAAQQQIITITDDDPPPSLTINDFTTDEAAGTANFTVTLSAASSKPIQVTYTLSNGTAGGDDYTPAPGWAMSGVLNLAAAQPNASIPVTILQNGLAELNETFNVTLSNPVNASIVDGTGVATIVDDEARVPIDPSLPGQYFPDVISDTTEAGYIQIFNPHLVAVTAKLTYTWPNGSGSSTTIAVPAQQRANVDLAGVAGVGGTGPLSVVVQSLDASRPLVSEHSGYSTPSTFAAGRNDLGASPAPTWYFSEGSANSFFTETVTVLNPTNGPVYVILDAIMPSGAPIRITKTIDEGPGRWTLNMNAHAGNIGDHGLIVSALVPNTQTPANIVVQRTLRWPAGGTTVESSTTSGTSFTANNWYFGDGGKGAWSNYLAFMNPSPTPASAIVSYVHDNGQVYTQTVDVAPSQRVTVSPPASMPDGGFAIHVGPYNNLTKFIVERSMYSGAGFALGSLSTPSAVPANTWRFAEGVSDGTFDTFFLVFNASTVNTSVVTLTFRKVGGGVATQVVTIPPRRRAVVYADGVSGMGTASYATEVTTNGNQVVVERSMFWPGGTWAGSHSSMGRPQ